MTVAVIAIAVVFIVCETLHFKHERELIRRLASKNEAEYVQNYEPKEKKPTPPSPAKEAMNRWKSGKKG